MTKIVLALTLFFSFGVLAQSKREADPCVVAKEWRLEVCRFAEANLKHSAWGFEHGKQDYLLAKDLAAADGHAIDDDTLFAASLLHDMGLFLTKKRASITLFDPLRWWLQYWILQVSQWKSWKV
ncbi:MAG: hypothetical protein R3B54_07530 [Bdellovibrionota bacterium]